MKLRLFTGLAAIVSMTLVSCYPYPPNHGKKRAGKAQEKITAPDQTKLKQEQELKKKAADEELKKKREEAERRMAENNDGTVDPPTGGERPPEPKTNDYPFANKVPGKEGFVFSPFNNKVVDVRDIPSGTLVQDPTYPASEKKYFRVP